MSGVAKPKRPCNACRNPFMPTKERTRLCRLCFEGKRYTTQASYTTQGHLSGKVALNGST